MKATESNVTRIIGHSEKEAVLPAPQHSLLWQSLALLLKADEAGLRLATCLAT